MKSSESWTTLTTCSPKSLRGLHSDLPEYHIQSVFVSAACAFLESGQLSTPYYLVDPARFHLHSTPVLARRGKQIPVSSRFSCGNPPRPSAKTATHHAMHTMDLLFSFAEQYRVKAAWTIASARFSLLIPALSTPIAFPFQLPRYLTLAYWGDHILIKMAT